MPSSERDLAYAAGAGRETARDIYAPLNQGAVRDLSRGRDGQSAGDASSSAPLPHPGQRFLGNTMFLLGLLLAICVAIAALSLTASRWPKASPKPSFLSSEREDHAGPVGLTAGPSEAVSDAQENRLDEEAEEDDNNDPVAPTKEGRGMMDMLDGAVDKLMGRWRSHGALSPEWLIVGEGYTDVRAEGSATAAKIGHKIVGTRVVGEKKGDWLALKEEPGFVHMSRLRQRELSFARIPNGTCSGHGRFQIEDPITCQAAARALRLQNRTMQAEFEDGPHSGGCRVRGARGSICCSHACPAPTTTTSTTTTSSSSSTTTSRTVTTITLSTTTTTTPMPTTTHPTGNPSLFCFAVIRALSYEAVLLRAFYPKSVSLFGCNDWVVYSDKRAWLGGRNYSIESEAPKAVYVGLWLNVNIFMNAWEKIFQEGRFRQQDWTVKVDPDAVFLPERLRQHIAPYTGAPKYFLNCAQFKSMQGPLEILSKPAVEALIPGHQNCLNNIDQSHIGEDGFLQKCMEQLGIQAQADYGILIDQYCGQNPKPCTNTWSAAFHPFKSDWEYDRCLREAGYKGGSILQPKPKK